MLPPDRRCRFDSARSGRPDAGSRLFRPPARALDALLHRDVGALQLLRDARVPHSVHDRASGAGGLGFADADAASIYGTYTGSVWGAAILGGLVADRVARPVPKRARSAGSSSLRATSRSRSSRCLSSTPGLALIVIGTGLLKPNVSTLVGSLYRAGRHAPRRRVLALLHGHQPRRVHRPARRRLSRAARRLASRLRVGRRRHDCSA